MKYTGQFKDINENLYKVNIITDNDSTTTKTVTLGTTPFVTEIETSEEHLYKPVKYSSATIRMINDDYSFDLYCAEAQENKVTLVDKDNVIRWIGYTTPNLYSQGYENEVEEIEIECIDALATLQYYKYHPIKDNKKNIVSFIDIIDYLLGKCNVYTTYYISNNTDLPTTFSKCLFNYLYISEQNFFDEDNEPMTMQEVLEEICKYLNVTCIADGTSVYFLDYDAIKNNINTYYQFTVGNTTSSTLVTLSQFNEIDGSDYVENGGQISLDNVYNRVAVKDSLYSFKPVIPELFGSGLIRYMMFDFNMNMIPYQEFIIDSKEADGKYKCFFKYYNHENYKTYYYDKKTLTETVPLGVVNYLTTQNNVGATILRHYHEKIENESDIINSIEWKDYILLHNHNTYDGKDRPFFELNINDRPPSFISQDSYFIIKMNYLINDIPNEMIPYEGEYTRKEDDFASMMLYLTCSLECNNRWWDGEKWSGLFTTFKLYFDGNGTNDHFIGRTFNVKNNISYDMGLDDVGYAIPVPPIWMESITMPKFIVYQPHNVDGSHFTHSAWISDFEINVALPNKYAAYEEHEDDKETDTEYTNVINSNFVNELDDIEFKICTWDNKENNYSSVMLYYVPYTWEEWLEGINGNEWYYNEYLDKTYNKATQQTLRQEEHLIYRLVTQYSTPSAILNLNLKNEIKPYCLLSDKWLPNKLFIVDSITTDWEYNKAEIKLIEKK